MNKFGNSLVLLLVSLAFAGAVQQYVLQWSDEFNGTTLDTTKWVYNTGNQWWGNNELQYYTDSTDNVFLQDDNLVITALQENLGGSNYTSGRITTLGKFDFQYGKVEISAKLPDGQGMWPAFWMMGANGLPWPACGEMDIMEFVGYDKFNVYSATHGTGFDTVAIHYNSAGFKNDYHTYGLIWEPNSLQFYVDDVIYATVTPSHPELVGKTWIFNDYAYYILLNLAVGGDWAGAPDATTTWPQQYFVDYVRVYQLEEVEPVEEYVLQWSDEFTDSTLDTSKWGYEIGEQLYGDLQYYTSNTNNVFLSSGDLVISALEESMGTSSYTSGRLNTAGKYSFKYGKVEMRAKLPNGVGMTSAFLMVGDNALPWPECGEIDISTLVGIDNLNIYSAGHGVDFSAVGSYYSSTGFNDDYHTYGLIWEEDSIQFYVDDDVYFTLTPSSPELVGKDWLFNDSNYYMILNLAVGGGWAGAPDITTTWPQRYFIDYIRVYQKEIVTP